jgi:sugar phosphate isomerase/epimerase
MISDVEHLTGDYVSLTNTTWPITAALLQFPAVNRAGVSAQDAGAEAWMPVLREVTGAGFSYLDLTDSWLRPGDLSSDRLDELTATARQAGLAIPVISVTRKSVIDPVSGEANLAYAHRTIDAAAQLGVQVVCLGLHRPFTETQKEQLWFWTVDGAQDPVNDLETWQLAVRRYAELGRHAAEVGVLLSLELYEDTYLGTADSAVNLIQDIGMANVGLNPDVGNLIRLHRPVERWQEILEKTLPYTNYWQVKNYGRDENVARGHYSSMPLPLQFGIIDYRSAFKTAISLGFQGILCTEHYGGDGLGVSAANREYLVSQVLPQSAEYVPGFSKVTQPVGPWS